MSQHSPKQLVLGAPDPTTLDHWHVQYLDHATGDIVVDSIYPSDGGSTTIEIGSNGSEDNLTDGQIFDIRVSKLKNGVEGPKKLAPTGPFTNVNLPDDNFTIEVVV